LLTLIHQHRRGVLRSSYDSFDPIRFVVCPMPGVSIRAAEFPKDDSLCMCYVQIVPVIAVYGTPRSDCYATPSKGETIGVGLEFDTMQLRNLISGVDRVSHRLICHRSSLLVPPTSQNSKTESCDDDALSCVSRRYCGYLNSHDCESSHSGLQSGGHGWSSVGGYALRIPLALFTLTHPKQYSCCRCFGIRV
jgi:hypothetical protein